MNEFEYVILGAGSAGFAAAIRANELGAPTVLLNHGLPPGGTCVNVGCVPPKTLLRIAATHDLARRRGVPGLSFDGVALDFRQAIDHELGLVEALRLRELPPSLLIIGGGPVALEFGQMYHHFGAQVTIPQRSQVLREAEPEVPGAVVRILSEEGIQIYESVQCLQAWESGRQKHVEVQPSDGQHAEFVGDQLLIGTGKEANSAHLGLNIPGVQTGGDRRAIVVDETMRTTARYIWAAGDVVRAPKRLETTGAKEGRLATDNALHAV